MNDGSKCNLLLVRINKRTEIEVSVLNIWQVGERLQQNLYRLKMLMLHRVSCHVPAVAVVFCLLQRRCQERAVELAPAISVRAHASLLLILRLPRIILPEQHPPQPPATPILRAASRARSSRRSQPLTDHSRPHRLRHRRVQNHLGEARGVHRPVVATGGNEGPCLARRGALRPLAPIMATLPRAAAERGTVR
jgi:hypothetical protein